MAAWNGTGWHSLGTGTNNQVNDLAFTPDGVLWVAGGFTTAGDLNIGTGLAWWLGTGWTYPDIQPLPNTGYDALAVWPDGTVYASFESQTASGPALQG